MRKIRKLLSLICAFAMLAALIPTSLAVTVGAETVTTEYDLNGSGFGTKPICGPFSFWYANAADYDNPDNLGYSVIRNPDKLILLDTVSHITSPQKGYAYKNCRSELDTYNHFMRLDNGGAMILLQQSGIANVVMFTAPADGTYTYNINAHTWDDLSTVVDIGTEKSPSSGQWGDFKRFTAANTPVSDSKSFSMKAGERLMFVFRFGGGGITINSLTVKGVCEKTEPKAGDVFSFNAAQLAFNVSSPYSLEYYGKDFGGYPSDTGSHKSLPVIKDDGLNPGGKFNFYTDAEDSKTHISVNAAQNKAYFYASSRTENHIITFTAPVCGEYTYNLKGKITETGRDWSLCASFCKGGNWFNIDHGFTYETRSYDNPKSVYLKKGETVNIIIRADSGYEGWVEIESLSFGLKTVHSPVESKESLVLPSCCVPGSYENVTTCSICGAELSRVNTVIPASGDKVITRLTDDMSVIEVSPEITAANAVVSVKDELKYGKAVYADGKLTYTPTKAAGGVEDVVLEITSGEHTHTHTVKIIPAPAVYYEDGVFTYGEGWEEITGDTLSGGKAHKATVFGEQFAKAEFTFKGTGFDLIASTSAASGTAFISVKSTKEGSEAKNYLIDTYYTGDKAINQAPVLKITGLEYGEYTVTVTTGYSAVFSHDRASYEFVIDAIRVYDPAGDSEEALTKYKEDGIAYPDYIKVRDILIKAGSFSTDSDINGAVFIDGNNGTASIADYKTKGPKNEVYLAKDQAIAFGFTVPAGAKYVKIGMRSVYGNDLSCSVGGKDITIGSAEYVDITDFAGETIVIRNSGDGLLSVTDIVVSYEAEKVSETGMTFTMTGSSLMAALSSESDDNGTEESVIPDGGNNPVTPEQPKNDKNPDTNTTDTDAPETEKPEDNTPDTDIPDGEDDNDKIPDDKPARPAENAPVAPGGRLADMIGRFIISVIKNIIAALLG